MCQFFVAAVVGFKHGTHVIHAQLGSCRHLDRIVNVLAVEGSFKLVVRPSADSANHLGHRLGVFLQVVGIQSLLLVVGMPENLVGNILVRHLQDLVEQVVLRQGQA